MVLAVPSWLGLMSMAFMIWTAMAQWDDDMLRPFECVVLFGTFVSGGISAIISAYLLWKERRISLFLVTWTPFIIVAGCTILGRYLEHL